ncbi:MAG: hypothetical protein J6Q82_08695 [Clostridia bacterium]|nr:hypothetical protein [Clostridia bacterium]
MTYHSTENRSCYFPPFLSNGEITMAPDAEGTLGYTKPEYRQKGITAFDGIVVRAARRSGLCHSLQARLFPFGKFVFRANSNLTEWSQTLRAERGFFESDCLYEDGTSIHSQGFIHPEQNIYALKKTFRCNEKRQFFYDVTLFGHAPEIEKYITTSPAEVRDGVCCIGFKMYGMEVFSGELRAWIDKDFTVSLLENGARLTFEVLDGDEVNFYYILEDDMNGVDFAQILQEYQAKIRALRFDGLLDECEQHYKAFSELGYVHTSDEMLNSIYKTALYGVKCNTTNYSIAVGLNNGAWDGRFFAFDEYTSYLGLLGANRLQLAKRVPSFRSKVCLTPAIKRASDYHRNEDTEDMARFLWESGEHADFELAPLGCWLDHIFHIPLVGIGAYEYFEYSQDKSFLEECYPMIRACAKFITKHMLYRDGERLYIGKCTDLERLGASVEHPFMTVCGCIELLRCCAKAAKILNVDEAYASECEDTAEKLYKNLPVENETYVPHLGCKQKSIAVFAGKFPFDILEDTDEKMLRAWEDFENQGDSFGNMYPVGKKISPWYACWKALGYARAKLGEKAYDALRQSYASVGVFHEMFEINEDACRRLPWFSTASGIFLVAVNEMLLQSDSKIIRILPAFPHNTDVSFKLAAKGGITVEAVIKKEQLASVRVLQGEIDVTHRFTIEF